MVPFSTRSQLLCRAADTVLVAEIGEAAGSALIIDIIKPASVNSPRRGGTVPFVEEGRTPTDAPLAPRTGYLLFARWSDGRLVGRPETMFELTNDGLVLSVTRRATRPFEDDDLHSIPSVETLARVREHCGQRRR